MKDLNRQLDTVRYCTENRFALMDLDLETKVKPKESELVREIDESESDYQVQIDPTPNAHNRTMLLWGQSGTGVDLVVPREKFTAVEKEVDKLNARAQRCGFPPIKIDVLELGPEIKCKLYGDSPTIEGFIVAGVVNHKHRLVFGDVPNEFRDTEPHCDHCNKLRKRNETIILEKHGIYQRVGTSCVADFIGQEFNSQGLVSFLEAVSQLVDTVQREKCKRLKPIDNVYDTKEVIQALVSRYCVNPYPLETIHEKAQRKTCEKAIDRILRSDYTWRLRNVDVDAIVNNLLAWGKISNPEGKEYFFNVHSLLTRPVMKATDIKHLEPLIRQYMQAGKAICKFITNSQRQRKNAVNSVCKFLRYYGMNRDFPFKVDEEFEINVSVTLCKPYWRGRRPFYLTKMVCYIKGVEHTLTTFQWLPPGCCRIKATVKEIGTYKGQPSNIIRINSHSPL